MQDKTALLKFGVRKGELDMMVKKVLAEFPDVRVYALYGQMGAGKTTIIKAFCRQLGVKDGMSSPTFSLVNEYQNDKEEKIYHFDFYRIEDEREALDIGTEEYFYSGAYCFVEWPENIIHLLPEKHLEIRITTESSEYRTIEVQLHG